MASARGVITNLISLTKPATKGPRGLRNNNPGNIRHSATHWLGQSEVQTDKLFVQFDTMVYGIRAIAKCLQTYQLKYHLNTVAELIERWAPPSENNTKAYIDSIEKCLHDKFIVDMTNKTDLFGMVDEIIHHENGMYLPFYSITDGISLALEPK